MVLAGVDFWYDSYGLWPWQAKPRPKTIPCYLVLVSARFVPFLAAFPGSILTKFFRISNEAAQE